MRPQKLTGNTTMKYIHVGILSVGHLVTDINQGASLVSIPEPISTSCFSFHRVSGVKFLNLYFDGRSA